MNKKIGSILLTTIIASAIVAAFAATARADKIVFVVPIALSTTGTDKTGGGGVSDNPSTFLKRVCDIISKKTGDDVECAIVDKPNNTMLTPQTMKKYIQAIEAKNYAGIYISGNDYYQLLASGYDKMVPAAQISFKKKTVDQACLYTRASDGFKSVDDLKSKTWGGSYFYMGSRFIMYNNGIDLPLKKFFGKMVFEQNDFWTNMADQLLAGRIDVFGGSTEEEIMGRARDKKYGAIKTLACSPFRATHMIAFNKTNLSKEKMDQIRGLLFNAHKDKDWGAFQFMFTIINGHFVPFDDAALKVTKEFVDTSVSRGWLKEQLAFIAGK
jgi:hypothetical protein